ncbi:MAG: hypothetical protein H6577_02580 [Lewinellaceae bacterium]|nr:hypothetical protein [Saprospiraceae bacterium]MCB9336995.1 hypothetical protein [Lewinellaceae bacterium]
MSSSILLLYVFKKRGDFIISGNLLAAVVSIVLAVATFGTGGLYSDNLLWMMAAPLLALLFANIVSGIFWLSALILFTIFLFLLDLQTPGSYREQTYALDGLYFVITFIGLFIMVVGIVFIFAKGQEIIIKALDEKQRQLSLQKAELTKQTQSLLEAEAKILASNKELSQFASAAAHDLKEPLRMINVYTQLIKKNLAAHTDPATKEYMGFVTDGVMRMEKLLVDLLEYSRLGRKNGQPMDVNLNDTLFVVINNLMASMKDTQAAVLANNLPVVKGSTTEMMQLFQNLIANSIKFRQKGIHPVIEINHHLEGGRHTFLFKDNGIGVPEHSRENIFNIFERLHSKEEYEGTGIGLATCKKIVNNLGGDIWVKPAETEGTVFCFTIPAQQN